MLSVVLYMLVSAELLPDSGRGSVYLHFHNQKPACPASCLYRSSLLLWQLCCPPLLFVRTDLQFSVTIFFCLLNLTLRVFLVRFLFCFGEGGFVIKEIFFLFNLSGFVCYPLPIVPYHLFWVLLQICYSIPRPLMLGGMIEKCLIKINQNCKFPPTV